ncbi:MAG: DUF5688 family protein [Butyrivibrio sp.]|nr:DUF5688 family protein [Muribaculum sp.]MCM1551610.1 DUF5688 family protein [Butyrivibrio sp.]
MKKRKKLNKGRVDMDIRSFAEMVSRAVSEELGSGCQVKLQEVIKNNGVILQGLVILAKEQNISPTIYLNSFLDAYEAGVPLVGIVTRILEIYKEDLPESNINMEFFREFEKVRPRICYKVINRSRNRGLLERIPHIDFLDLSICFFYSYQNEALGFGSILIYNSHMEMWGCSTETLLKLAQENTKRLFPWRTHDMGELLRELIECEELGQGVLSDEGEEDADEECPMRVLTNKRRLHGATCMIYPGLLNMLADEMDEDLYILPSSIHEVILMPESEVDDPQMLMDMVREVNTTQVEPEEILSDHLYFYKRRENRVEVVKLDDEFDI